MVLPLVLSTTWFILHYTPQVSAASSQIGAAMPISPRSCSHRLHSPAQHSTAQHTTIHSITEAENMLDRPQSVAQSALSTLQCSWTGVGWERPSLLRGSVGLKGTRCYAYNRLRRTQLAIRKPWAHGARATMLTTTCACLQAVGTVWALNIVCQTQTSPVCASNLMAPRLPGTSCCYVAT
jgi:hypothetical protein